MHNKDIVVKLVIRILMFFPFISLENVITGNKITIINWITLIGQTDLILSFIDI